MNSEKLFADILKKMHTEGIEKTIRWGADQLKMDESDFKNLIQMYAQNPKMNDQELILLKQLT